MPAQSKSVLHLGDVFRRCRVIDLWLGTLDEQQEATEALQSLVDKICSATLADRTKLVVVFSGALSGLLTRGSGAGGKRGLGREAFHFVVYVR